MVRWVLLVGVVLCGSSSLAAEGAALKSPQAAEVRKLRALLDADWESRLREEPTWATYVGDARYNDRWPDLSPEGIERTRARERASLAKARRIDRAKLPPAEQLNLDLFLFEAQLDVEEQRFPTELQPVTQRGGPYAWVAQLAASAPKRNVKDYEDLLARLRAGPALVDQVMALMRRGAETGVTPPRVTLRSVEELVQNHIVDDPTQHPVYQTAFKELPASIPEPERQRLQREAAAAIRDGLVPAYRRFQAFWKDAYFPRTRESIAASDLPGGREWYALRVRRMTTTDLTPEQIHQLGLSEVARLRREMEAVKASTGFTGTLEEFFTFLRTDKRFFFTDKEALLAAYRDIAKRIDPQLPRLFGTLPRLPYGIEPVPAYAEKTQTTAYYQGGTLEAGRAGTFFANTYDLASRPKWEMEALTVHEAVPGHHLQIALAQELPDVPAFRRNGGITAFVEGWGLYSESLGPELGLYTDPYAKFGQLTYEMWRAIRLVVDTGLHAKGWSRKQAIDFFMANAGKTRHDVEVEVDRYLVMPGQALAYKIGELKRKELRAYATRELGPRFDVRRFHDTVLLAGPLPLDVLERRVRAWVAQEKRRTA